MGISIPIGFGIVAMALALLIASLVVIDLEVWNDISRIEPNLRFQLKKNVWSTAIRVDSVSFVSSTEVEIRVTNTGSLGIPVSQFNHVDLVVVYFVSGEYWTALYCNYNPSGGSATWRIESVITSGSIGESLNPISANNGVWDPGETLVIRAELVKSADQAKEPCALLSAPWGVYGYKCGG